MVDGERIGVLAEADMFDCFSDWHVDIQLCGIK